VSEQAEVVERLPRIEAIRHFRISWVCRFIIEAKDMKYIFIRIDSLKSIKMS